MSLMITFLILYFVFFIFICLEIVPFPHIFRIVILAFVLSPLFSKPFLRPLSSTRKLIFIILVLAKFDCPDLPSETQRVEPARQFRQCLPPPSRPLLLLWDSCLRWK